MAPVPVFKRTWTRVPEKRSLKSGTLNDCTAEPQASITPQAKTIPNPFSGNRMPTPSRFQLGALVASVAQIRERFTAAAKNVVHRRVIPA